MTRTIRLLMLFKWQHLPFLVGACMLALIVLNWFNGVRFFGGADLGFGVERPIDFLHIYQHNWNGLDRFGVPIYGYLEAPYHQMASWFDSLNTGSARTLPLLLSTLAAYSLTYFGLMRFKLGCASCILGGLVMSAGPAITLRFWYVPILASAGTIVLSALILYTVCLVLAPVAFRPWRLVLPMLLLMPLYLLAFTNPYFAIGAMVPLILLVPILIWITIGERRSSSPQQWFERSWIRGLFPLILFLTVFILLVYVPLFVSSDASDRIGIIAPNDTSSLVVYVKMESNAPFYVSMFSYDQSDLTTAGLARLFLSGIILVTAFIPLLVFNSLNIYIKRLYIFFLLLLVAGWMLEKGIKEPFPQINEAFYRFFGSIAYGFRSPLSKFGILQAVALSGLVPIGSYVIWRNLNLKSIRIGSVKMDRVRLGFAIAIIFLLIGYTITDPLVGGNLGPNMVMKQSEDLIIPHLENINELVQSNSQGRVLLLPMTYGIWSAYKLANDSQGYQYVGPNEYAVVGRPLLTQFESGDSIYLKLLYEEKSPTAIRDLLRLGNVDLIVLDNQKVDPSGVFDITSQRLWLDRIKGAVGPDLVQIPSIWPFELYHYANASSYVYAAVEHKGVNSEIDLLEALAGGEMNTINTSLGVGNVSSSNGNISFDFSSTPASRVARVEWRFATPINVTDLPDLLATMVVPDDYNVSAIIMELLSSDGNGSRWVLSKPYPFIEKRMRAEEATPIGANNTNLTAIDRVVLIIGTINKGTENYHFQLPLFNIVPSTRLDLTPLLSRCINFDSWEVENNISGKLVIFSQAFDQHWRMNALGKSGETILPEAFSQFGITAFRHDQFNNTVFEINYDMPQKMAGYYNGIIIFVAILLFILIADISWILWRRHYL